MNVASNVDRQMRLPGIPDEYLGASPPALCAPVIKYAGSKRWLVSHVLPRLHAHLANASGTYVEPFCGGLAVGLGLGWPRSVFSDLSSDLINLYCALGTDAGQVADEVDRVFARGTDEATYYEVRREAWPESRAAISQFGWAARVVYLNRVGFNGLWRVNRRGQHNVPWGDREGVSPPSRGHLLRAGEILGRAEVVCADFGGVLLQAEEMAVRGEGVAAVLDPPYGADLMDVSSRGPRARSGASRVFTAYAGAFPWEDQVRLADHAGRLARAGALVVASNTWADRVCDLYSGIGFTIFQVGVRHSVGATGERRGRRAEMLAVDEAHVRVFDAAGADIKMVRG